MDDLDDVDSLLWEDDDPEEEPREPLNIERELERFRAQWHQELRKDVLLRASDPAARRMELQPIDKTQQPSLEEQAKYLFIQGVHAEHGGKLYDAIKYYRRAVQLVPDIEGRIDDYRPRRRKDRQDSESSVGSASSEVDLEDLLQHFTNLQANDNGPICEATVPTNGNGHIAMLPVEILMYIFKWVVSSEVDLTSLVRLSEVCRGFFVVTQDEELWKLICQRVFGRNCERPGSYRTYRNMYIEKPHVRFNGCFISRQEYYRQGEQSLDGLYRPYHLVEYFRYVRFFPDGQVFMLTSPEPPHVEVGHLQSRNAVVQGILHGYYKMSGNQVTALLKRRKTPDQSSFYYRKSRRQNINAKDGEQSFHVEFDVKSAGRRMCSQLSWRKYAIHTFHRATGQEQVLDFELSNSSYPPLIFSRVKSYTAASDRPLK